MESCRAVEHHIDELAIQWLEGQRHQSMGHELSKPEQHKAFLASPWRASP